MGLADMWAEFSARRFLQRLMDQLGIAGLSAAAVTPALLAAIDQHSAAVRDIVIHGVEGSAAAVSAVLLAGYARGVLDQARVEGWRPALPVSATDWITVRLIGVCALARGLERPLPEIDGRGVRA